MAINFPSSPILGQTVNVGNKVYAWNGIGWEIPMSAPGGGGGGGTTVTTDDNAPSIPKDGELWWKSNTGVFYIYYDDGNTKQWVEAAAPAGAAPTYFGPNYVQGLTSAPNSTTPLTQIDIQPGSARNGQLYTVAPSLLTKKLDAVFAVGNNAGGLDTGVKQASKSYFAHEIRRQSDGLADTLFSLSPSAPTLPTGWDLVQRIFAFKTDSSGNIVPFLQSANKMTVTMLTEVSATVGSAVSLRVLATVPIGIVTRARLTTAINVAAASTIQLFVYDAAKNAAWGYSLYSYATTVAGVAFNYGQIGGEVETNMAGQVQIGIGLPGGSGTASLVCFGWDDFTVPRIGA